MYLSNMNFKFIFCAILTTVILKLCWSQFVLPSERPLTQAEEFHLQIQNQMNGRSVDTPAFAMTQGYKNTNGSFLAFRNETLNVNVATFKSLGAMRARTPGLYMFTATVAGSENATTVAQIRKDDQVLATIESRNGIQTSATTFSVLSLGQSAYLLVKSGDIRENDDSDDALNSFSGVLLVAAIQNNLGNPNFPQG